MKAIFTPLFLFLLGLLATNSQPIYAQQTTYSQEDSAVTTGELKRFYRYITRANVEEKTLLKVGFWPNAGDRDYTGRPSFRVGLNADVSVERKLTPSFSVLAGFDVMLRYNRFRRFSMAYDKNGQGDLTDTDKLFRNLIYAKIGTRYYYSMAKSIRKGRSANNFSGNYAGLQVAKVIVNQANIRMYDTKTGQIIRTDRSNGIGTYDFPVVFPHWGMQRRIGRLGFVDVNVGPEITLPFEKRSNDYPHFYFFEKYHKPTFSLRVNAVIGLGW